MKVAMATEVKNPDNIRQDCAAITLWILRFAQNDSSQAFVHNNLKSILGLELWPAFQPLRLAL